MKLMKKIAPMLFAAILAVCSAVAVPVFAAEMKTAVVVSVTDVETGLKAAGQIAAKMGFPDAVKPAQDFVDSIDVLNQKQPKGIVILSDGETFSGYAFAPISDFTSLPMMAMFLEDMEEMEDGKYEILAPNGMAIQVKQEEEWVFWTIGTELPEELPADPVKLLEGLNQKYLLSFKVNFANLPQELCVDYLDFARAMAGAVSADELAANNINASLDQVEKLLAEANVLVEGIAVDPETSDVTLEAMFDVLPGTDMAKQVAASASVKTGSIGFFQPENAAVALIGSSLIDENQKEQLQAMLEVYVQQFKVGVEEQGLSGDEEELVSEIIGNLQEVISGTIDSGKLDIATTLLKNGTLLAITNIAEGKNVSDSLEKVVGVVPEEFKKYIKLEAMDYAGYKLSSFVLPLKESGCPELPEALKDQSLTVLVGVRDNSLCIAVGVNGDVSAELKKAIDASKKEVAMPKTVLVLTPNGIASIVKGLGVLDLPDAPEEAKAIFVKMAELPNDANITVQQSVEGTTAKAKFVFSGKLFPFIGELIKSAQKQSTL